MFREIGSKQLPRFLKKYFWETDFDKLTLPIHQFYVIERVLEYGDDEAIHWVKETSRVTSLLV